MTAYIITPEQHAQIVDALEIARTTAMNNVMAARIPECGDFAAIAQNLDWSVATLKAMKPVEPVGYLSRCSRFYKTRMMAVENFEQVAEPVYAKEQQ